MQFFDWQCFQQSFLLLLCLALVQIFHQLRNFCHLPLVCKEHFVFVDRTTMAIRQRPSKDQLLHVNMLEDWPLGRSWPARACHEALRDVTPLGPADGILDSNPKVVDRRVFQVFNMYLLFTERLVCHIVRHLHDVCQIRVKRVLKLASFQVRTTQPWFFPVHLQRCWPLPWTAWLLRFAGIVWWCSLRGAGHTPSLGITHHGGCANVGNVWSSRRQGLVQPRNFNGFSHDPRPLWYTFHRELMWFFFAGSWRWHLPRFDHGLPILLCVRAH
mmetsp:Transcript_4644/g.10708  ORF Transcript_4644/g.10708 Transcript_4644/m.10708 type:complete len:271 (-) Transcript_4644:251-1063(-)